jgi:hypothetical protein
LRSSTLDSLHTVVSPGSIGFVYTYSGPFREAQISEQPLWGFSSSNPDRSQSRAEQSLCFTKKCELLITDIVDKGGYTGYLVGIADDSTELVTLLVDEQLTLDTLEALPTEKAQCLIITRGCERSLCLHEIF